MNGKFRERLPMFSWIWTETATKWWMRASKPCCDILCRGPQYRRICKPDLTHECAHLFFRSCFFFFLSSSIWILHRMQAWTQTHQKIQIYPLETSQSDCKWSTRPLLFVKVNKKSECWGSFSSAWTCASGESVQQSGLKGRENMRAFALLPSKTQRESSPERGEENERAVNCPLLWQWWLGQTMAKRIWAHLLKVNSKLNAADFRDEALQFKRKKNKTLSLISVFNYLLWQVLNWI